MSKGCDGIIVCECGRVWPCTITEPHDHPVEGEECRECRDWNEPEPVFRKNSHVTVKNA